MPVISSEDISSVVPTRVDLADPIKAAEVDQAIAAGEHFFVNINNLGDRANNGYSIYMFGALACGRRVCIRYVTRSLYFHVRCPPEESKTPEVFKHRIMNIVCEGGTDSSKSVSFGIDYMYPVTEFSTVKSPYIRVMCDSGKTRKNAMQDVRKAGYQTVSDDEGQLAYARMLFKEHNINTAGANVVKKYKVAKSFRDRGWSTIDKCSYLIDIEDLSDITCDAQAMLPYTNVIDRSLAMAWDIETYNPGTGEVPQSRKFGKYTNKLEGADAFTVRTYRIYMISCVFSLASSPHHIYDITLVTYNCGIIDGGGKISNGVIVVCKDEEDLIRSFAAIMARIVPDIAYGYNTSYFDWPIVLDAATDYGLVPTLVQSMSSYGPERGFDDSSAAYSVTREFEFKQSADTTQIVALRMSATGMLDIDTKLMFDRKYPRANQVLHLSLNAYLKMKGLDKKEDLPYELQALYCKFGDFIGASNAYGARETLGKIRDSYGYYITSIDNPAARTLDDFNALLSRFMAQTALYCMVDSYRVHQLMISDLIISDARELSNLAGVFLEDTIWMAIGKKVTSFFARGCFKRNIAFSYYTPYKSNDEKYTYGGGRVDPPITGVNRDAPITGIDFGSLYPSIIRDKNLSQDRLVRTLAEKERLEALGYEFNTIGPIRIKRHSTTCECHPAEEITVWTIKHNGVVDNVTGDERIVTHYQKHIKYTHKKTGEVREHVLDLKKDANPGDPEDPIHSARTIMPDGDPNEYVREVDYKPVKGRVALPGESLGIMGQLMNVLFDERKPLKKALGVISKQIEELEKAGAAEEVLAPMRIKQGVLAAKSNAIKVLSNSFYGNAGSFRSAIYDICVAAATTMTGRQAIAEVRQFCAMFDYKLYYGDTDSAYVSVPQRYINAMNAAYESIIAGVECQEDRLKHRLEHWTRKVDFTMKDMNKLVEEINDYLICKTGARYMTIAYEEVGFPTLLGGKKKYAMVAHIETINFYPENFFVKGFDMVKQSKSDLTIKYGNDFLRMIFDPACELTPMELAIKMIDRFRGGADNVYTNFIKEAKYKTNNTANSMFVNRIKREKAAYMSIGDVERAERYNIPEVWERFKYIVCRRDKKYDAWGRKIDIKVSDQMELLNVYEKSQRDEHPLEIDITYYFRTVLASMLARFVSYMTEFWPRDPLTGEYYDVGALDNEQYSVFDKKTIAAATSYLMRYYKNKNTAVAVRATDETGLQYQRLGRALTSALNDDLYERYGRDAHVIVVVSTKSTLSEENDVSETIRRRWKEYIEELADIYKVDPAFIKGNQIVNPNNLNSLWKADVGRHANRYAALSVKESDSMHKDSYAVVKCVCARNRRIEEHVGALRIIMGATGDIGDIPGNIVKDINDAISLSAEDVSRMSDTLLKSVGYRMSYNNLSAIAKVVGEIA